MRPRWVVAAVVVCAVAAAPVLAIDLGDPAPKLKIKEWAKGGPVSLKEGKGKTTYIVEFWATWCGPCRQSIPHLTELQKKYKDKDVVMIGISDETIDKVKPFVEQMGDKMDYAVAIDNGGQTNEGYMRAFGINGIPHAFIVDKTGAIVWSGHPMVGMDQALDEILAGKYDLEKAKKTAKEEREASKIMEEMFPKYFQMVSEGGKAEQKKAAKYGDKILKKGKKNVQVMNALAWTILTDQRVKHRDVELAMKAAQAAFDLSEGKEPMILDTYARALWETGKRAEAVETQKKALELASDPEMKKGLAETLKKYEKEAKEKGPGDAKEGKKADKQKADKKKAGKDKKGEEKEKDEDEGEGDDD